MYQEVCFNRGTEAGGGGGVNVGYSLSPPSHFMLATGLQPQTTVSLTVDANLQDDRTLCLLVVGDELIPVIIHCTHYLSSHYWLRAYS